MSGQLTASLYEVGWYNPIDDDLNLSSGVQELTERHFCSIQRNILVKCLEKGAESPLYTVLLRN